MDARKIISLIALSIAAGALAGCDSMGGHRSDPDAARKALTTFLEAWQQGERPEALRAGSPEIIVGAPEWTAGEKLVAYRVLEPANDDGVNLHVPVELELESGQGRRLKRQVTYIVGTSPKITIFPE